MSSPTGLSAEGVAQQRSRPHRGRSPATNDNSTMSTADSTAAVAPAASGSGSNNDENDDGISLPGAGVYPLPAYLNFVPGGILYPKGGDSSHWVQLSGSGSPGPGSSSASPDTLTLEALKADATLRKFALLYAQRGRAARKSPDKSDEDNESVEMADANEGGINDDSIKVPHFLPSLSVLADCAFGSLTGVPTGSAKKWADTMVLTYLDPDDEEQDEIPTNEEEILQMEKEDPPRSKKFSPSSMTSATDLASVLRELHIASQSRVAGSPSSSASGATSPFRTRPCGYVFRRGDIAWNCRTCQTDATCVLCDTCFHNSNHEGHEVFFHRTTPGGCCDCGDAEAWKIEGCCPEHRPRGGDSSEVAAGEVAAVLPAGVAGMDGDDFEAVRAALRGKKEGEEILTTPPTALPPRFTAALAVVIGSAVDCLVRAADGSGIGSDPAQWMIRWADEVCKIAHGAPFQEDHYLHSSNEDAPPSHADEHRMNRMKTINPSAVAASPRPSSPSSKGDGGKDEGSPSPFPLPRNFRLHLRLHNDDVHTFDEVIDALYDPNHRQGRRHRSSPSRMDDFETPDVSRGLVADRDDAEEMTHHVDGDGQVTVRNYTTFAGAKGGYKRLKTRGLHCAVVSKPQVDLEYRARMLVQWMAEISAAHPAAAALVVHALVDASEGAGNSGSDLGGVKVWGFNGARMIPAWAGGVIPLGNKDEMCRRRFEAFPPHLSSSYLTREESERLHRLGLGLDPESFRRMTGCDPKFYTSIPYHLPSQRYRKSPHALWGTVPSRLNDVSTAEEAALLHPLLLKLLHYSSDVKSRAAKSSIGDLNILCDPFLVVDTDLRKQQEAERLTTSMYPHKLAGLYMISGVGRVPRDYFMNNDGSESTELWRPNPANWFHLLSISSFRAPVSPLLLLLLLDPYPPKQLRGAVHSLFLSLLVDSRFKCRFAAALGGVAYRPLSTLFCAGVGTEADTPLGFTVQIFTAGSLVRALGNGAATKLLLCPESEEQDEDIREEQLDIVTLPISLTVVRCIHSNLLGATKEVQMVLNNTPAGNGNDDDDGNRTGRNSSVLPALTYQLGEHPLTTLLPAATDDEFLDSRSTKHKRLPHLLRDLEYIFETPGTATRLLLPLKHPLAAPPPGYTDSDVLTFPRIWARLLRLAQGMDIQKRKISGGHVEYEPNRWLEAFGLSLNFASTRDALAESPTTSLDLSSDSSLESVKHAVGNLFTAILREIKMWLYREGLLETGLPLPPGGGAHHGSMGDVTQIEALQRSTLHVSSSQLGELVIGSVSVPASPVHEGVAGGSSMAAGSGNVNAVALSCATGIKMTEAQLGLIEGAWRLDQEQRRQEHIFGSVSSVPVRSGAAMGDWLRVPHSPLAGDSLSFHLPLHRALARSVRSICSVVVTHSVRSADPRGWWKLPVLDEDSSGALTETSATSSVQPHPLAELLRPTLRSSNCRVVWSSGPDCTPPEAQMRRSRSRAVSAAIASAKVVHSIADHPLRCLAAAQQIERHLWARNGSAAAGMALNYGSAPLCRSLRDLDLTMVQLSAAGMSIGLGARRVFALLMSRFSMDGYLCDPERRGMASSSSGASSSPGSPSGVGNSGAATISFGAGGHGGWVNPPRLTDPDHAVALSESFFTTLCLLVTELPAPPPTSPTDDTALRRSMRRELLHALAAEPRSHSEAMAAAAGAVTRRDESDGSAVGSGGGAFREVFVGVLRDIGRQKNQGSSRAAAGPPAYELRPECSDEYDPTFFHLRRHEHQHAMDNIARLRKQKLAVENRLDSKNGKSSNSRCLPLVSLPPVAHPRFLPCRLLLHIPAVDAAIRRALLFALTGGEWLPPPEPASSGDAGDGPSGDDHDADGAPSGNLGVSSDASKTRSAVTSSNFAGTPPISLSHFSCRPFHRPSSSFQKRMGDNSHAPPPFSPSVVASSSVSFLEVLQILTLQVHTLEECASLHRTHPGLDNEGKALSAGLSINSYLGRLIYVPESLYDVWALRRYPEGPLPSKGSGENRGSVLGLLIALYEHRADHSGVGSVNGMSESGPGDDGHGGARALAADGLKWLLRFVNALVDGAPSVSAAGHSATKGVPFRGRGCTTGVITRDSDGAAWTIDLSIREAVSGMLANLADLWPKEENSLISGSEAGDGMSAKSKEARKAAQQRALERMRKQQASFAASIAAMESGAGTSQGEKNLEEAEEEDLCIICRCDDADGENNGPLGYLGHVQRSRTLQLRAMTEMGNRIDPDGKCDELYRTYRVVGDRGCQLRATEAMDSAPVACLPMGSIVTVLQSKVSPNYDLLSRRVLVRHVSSDKSNGNKKVTEGWASIQSSQGYVILSPLANLCFTNTRWGATRPIIRQCGHAAHLGCVEAHCLSLHQRAAGEQQYDGRFAANIKDGEFLCPLCKQLSNILVPRDRFFSSSTSSPPFSRPSSQISTVSSVGSSVSTVGAEVEVTATDKDGLLGAYSPSSMASLRRLLVRGSRLPCASKRSDCEKGQKAIRLFGDHLIQAMEIRLEETVGVRKRQNQRWHPAIRRWDYEEEEGDDNSSSYSSPCIGSILRLLRQQHIAWAAVGHGAASAEASSRGTRSVFKDENISSSLKTWKTTDPWNEYNKHNRDSHPMLLELKRILTASSGLLSVLSYEMWKQLGSGDATDRDDAATLVGRLLADILDGQFWTLGISSANVRKDLLVQWSVLTAFLSSMPCHVARDLMLSQRHEARATAAAMWAVKGIGITTTNSKEPALSTDSSRHDSMDLVLSDARSDGAAGLPSVSGSRQTLSTNGLGPPVPLAVRQVFSTQKCDPTRETGIVHSKLPRGWGSMFPFDKQQQNTSNEQNQSSYVPPVPFRPAVASAFLYIPLLCWDISTLAGAVFSTLLANNEIDQQPKIDDFILSSRILLTGRLIQVLITPNGYYMPSLADKCPEVTAKESASRWTDEKISTEGKSLCKLLAHCQNITKENSDTKKNINEKNESEFPPARLLLAVGLAILPFVRSLVLLLRASLSVMRQRQRLESRRKGQKIEELSSTGRHLEALLENGEVLTVEDGFYLFEMLGGPLPSQIMTASSSSVDYASVSWLPLINRWLSAVVGLESHHGSRGKHLEFLSGTKNDPDTKSSLASEFSPMGGRNHRTELSGNETDRKQTSPLGNSMNNGKHNIPAAEPWVVLGLEGGLASRAISTTGDSTFASALRRLGANHEDVSSTENDVEDEDVEEDYDYEDFVDDDDDEDMADDDGVNTIQLLNQRFPGGVEEEGADEDEIEDMEVDTEAEEETADSEEAMGGTPLFAEERRTSSHGGLESKDDIDDVSDDNSSALSATGGKSSTQLDRDFAYVSRSPIIPYQPCLLGIGGIGPGPRGVPFECTSASAVMCDLSHLGIVHRTDRPCSGLIRLPISFVELYGLVNRVKGRDNAGTMDEHEDLVSSETAICLLTGAIMRSGSGRRGYTRATRPPGACTMHARRVGSGIGIFFLVQKCTVLLVHNNKSAYSASLYVDEHGEEDPGLRRGRPLFLNEARYCALDALWRQQGVPREVAQIRSTSDRVIRDNWY